MTFESCRAGFVPLIFSLSFNVRDMMVVITPYRRPMTQFQSIHFESRVTITTSPAGARKYKAFDDTKTYMHDLPPLFRIDRMSTFGHNATMNHRNA